MAVLAADLSSLVAGLPQQPPFRFVTGVTRVEVMEASQGIEVEAFLDVTEEMCAGHFPGAPIFPGVLLEEALGQACCTPLGQHPLVAQKGEFTPTWKGPRTIEQNLSVFPGDRVRLVCSIEFEEQGTRIFGKMSGQAFVVTSKGVEEAAMQMSADFLLMPRSLAERLSQGERTRRAQRRLEGTLLVNAALERVRSTPRGPCFPPTH